MAVLPQTLSKLPNKTKSIPVRHPVLNCNIEWTSIFSRCPFRRLVFHNITSLRPSAFSTSAPHNYKHERDHSHIPWFVFVFKQMCFACLQMCPHFCVRVFVLARMFGLTAPAKSCCSCFSKWLLGIGGNLCISSLLMSNAAMLWISARLRSPLRWHTLARTTSRKLSLQHRAALCIYYVHLYCYFCHHHYHYDCYNHYCILTSSLSWKCATA